MKIFPPSELIINADGSAFHLHLRPEQLADRVILLDIYPAREQPIDGVSSAALLEKICCKEKSLCQKDNLLEKIKEINPELIVTMGAGDIDRFVPDIERMLNE